mmetsp:Transcript_36494/g.81254  ORF Transcript_36494/g.81254 Transcript_36494/m.81254 type:complete len:113 (-) Transcript_36494:393-731(-)
MRAQDVEHLPFRHERSQPSIVHLIAAEEDSKGSKHRAADELCQQCTSTCRPVCGVSMAVPWSMPPVAVGHGMAQLQLACSLTAGPAAHGKLHAWHWPDQQASATKCPCVPFP